uniref:Ubiquitin-conjugating enzyme E2 Q2 n=1 Tax=Aceria tosichella TaxID=561515 RepID=A0A6G1S5T1_9ACAR
MSFIRFSRVSIALVVMVVGALAVQSMEERRASTRASKRLMNEFKQFHESDSYKNGVFTVELVDGNIYLWDIKLFKVDPDSRLYKDFQAWKERTGKDHILLRAAYYDDYPFAPPYVQLIYPILDGLTFGYICSELLTKSGWSSAYTIEPLVLQIATILSIRSVSLVQDNQRYSFDKNGRSGYQDFMNLVHPEFYTQNNM